MPTCATITQPRPRRTLCPICTRLSRREPAPITRVVQRAAVDRGVGADLHIVLEHDAAELRHAEEAARRSMREAEAVLADAGAGIDDHPVAEQRVAERDMRADPAVRAQHDAVADRPRGGPMRQRGPISAPAPITASGPISALGSIAASGATTADGCTPGRAGGDRMEQRRDPRPGDVGLGGHDRDGGRRDALGHVGMHDHRAGARARPAPAAYLRLSRKLTSLGSAVCSGATPVQHQAARRRLGLAPRRPPRPGCADRSGGRSGDRPATGGQSICPRRCAGSARPGGAAGGLRPAAARRGGLRRGGRRRLPAAGAAALRRRGCRPAAASPPARRRRAGSPPLASTLFSSSATCWRHVEVGGRAEDLRAVQHQVDAAADRHLLRHQLDGAVDLRHHVLAGLLDDPVALAERRGAIR